MANNNAYSAFNIAEKVRKLIAETKFSANGRQISIPVSAGISEFNVEDNGNNVFKKPTGLYIKRKETDVIA